MQSREAWSGRVGFVLATIGSAVGIGSIWKFPYEVGANGGGAFVLFYLVGLIAIVVPLMFAEFAIGRRGRGDPATSIGVVAGASGGGSLWPWVGTLGVATGFLILSFYSVIGGWTLAYGLETAWNGLPGTDAQAVEARYQAMLGDPWRMLTCHAVFMGTVALVVGRGVARGIEIAAKVLMPALATLMIALAAYAIVEGDVAAALRFLFSVDPDTVTTRAALEALGLGFFSIGVGLGLMITYAAYGDARVDLKMVAIVSVVADTAISILAGLAVFPLVFAHHLDPASGPGLVFVTLPIAFAAMPFGTVAAVAFFAMLFVAAVASAISLLEIVVALLIQRCGWRRGAASAVAAATCFVAGIATVLSFNLWSSWHPLGAFGRFRDATFFDVLDHLTSNVFLPAGGFMLALFAGWVMPVQLLAGELGLTPRSAALLRFTLRYVAPVGIAAATLAPFWV